jgi:K+-transporting ATPase ATPase C chain
MRLPAWLAQHLAAARALIVFTAVLGLAYPLLMIAVARIPGLAGHADGSFVSQNGPTAPRAASARSSRCTTGTAPPARSPPAGCPRPR